MRPLSRLLVCGALLGLAGNATAQAIREDLHCTDGRVWAAAVAGDLLYIGGEFAYVGPATGSGVPLDAATGQPPSSFPKVCCAGQVYAVVPDGSGGWYIGGSFSSVGGVPRSNLAHILADNTVSDWNPSPTSVVRALALDGSTLYVGGSFGSIGGQARNNIAALDVATGDATGWNPNANGTVYALAVSGSTIYAGGDFTTI